VSAAFCWAFIAGACLLFFKPTPAAEDPAAAVRESWLLFAETLATLVLGLMLMPPSHRSSDDSVGTP
jgi:hypothetical protein